MPKQLDTIPNPMMMWYSTPYYYYQQNNRHNTLESGQRKSRRITVGTLWNNQRMIWNKFRILYPPLMLVLLFIHGPSHHHQPHGCYANTVESSAKPPPHNYYTLLLVKSTPPSPAKLHMLFGVTFRIANSPYSSSHRWSCYCCGQRNCHEDHRNSIATSAISLPPTVG